MSFNIQPNDRELSLSTFGGLVSESNPSDLPEGVSPLCSDMQFLPGSVFSRFGMKKQFLTPMGTATVTYGKSYVDPTGVIRNLYLDSAGNLWVENVSASPGTYSLLTTTTPGTWAKSITAFGREYIAISDGLNGQEVPLQYDGTNLDRVTQDGPGAPPNISAVSLPSVAMAVTGAPLVLTLAESDPAGGDGSGYFTAINMFTASSVATVNIGNQVTIAGYAGASAPMNGTWNVIAVYTGSPNNLVELAAYLPPTTVFSVAAATGTVGGGVTAQRAGNLVTVKTTSAHQLQPGYQAQITGVSAGKVGTAISTIAINNEDNPGLATVTTSTAHGLVPGLFVSLGGIKATAVGTATSLVRAGGVVTVKMAAGSGLTPGGVVTISGVATASFNTITQVLAVTTTTNAGDTFTYAQADVDASDTTGTIGLNWPIPDTATPSYFQVEAAPTATTFQVSINYSDGAWTGGTVSYAWDGTFFVQSVTTTTFTYQQYGPDATTTDVGTVTPFGQAAPGQHQMQVIFLTRQGATTEPSPPVKFVANGGQFLSITNIPIGPSNIVARILAFTGAQGAYFFYIPDPPQVNGQLVGTSTQINDNTTTSIVLDFSDNTLFAAIGISVQGNNLANQIVLEGALGFGFFGSRLLAYGQRNRIQTLLNLSFDGGYLPSAAPPNLPVTLPTGWTASGTGGTLDTGHYGQGWKIGAITGGGGNFGKLSQSFYETYTGVPIATGNTRYKIRVWLKPSTIAASLIFTVAITSASASFSTLATIAGNLMSTSGSFLEATFAAKTPVTIPADLTLSIYAASAVSTVATLLVDEISVIYADTPYLNQILYGSYVDNLEGFDGLSGKFGPSIDTRKVMDFGVLKENLYLLTRDPSGRLHEVIDNGVTEPAGWAVDEVGANCGALSAFGLTRSQADDASASGGEEWMAWASASGARIFAGGEPFKISQEIQPDWTGISKSALLTVWALNDPGQIGNPDTPRVIYFGLPTGTAGTPDRIYHVNYRQLDSASQIAAAAPVHIGFNGKRSAHDNGRKWCPWKLAMNGAALMYRDTTTLTPVFFGGNGLAPGSGSGFGNVYVQDASVLTDDDYGQIFPLYVTYFFPSTEAEQELKLGAHRKMLAYLTGQLSGVGTVRITPLRNTLSNAWPLICTRTLAVDPNFDLEWTGGNTTAQRMAFKVESFPVTGTDNQLVIQKLVPVMRTAVRIPVRGSAA